MVPPESWNVHNFIFLSYPISAAFTPSDFVSSSFVFCPFTFTNHTIPLQQETKKFFSSTCSMPSVSAVMPSAINIFPCSFPIDKSRPHQPNKVYGLNSTNHWDPPNLLYIPLHHPWTILCKIFFGLGIRYKYVSHFIRGNIIESLCTIHKYFFTTFPLKMSTITIESTSAIIKNSLYNAIPLGAWSPVIHCGFNTFPFNVNNAIEPFPSLSHGPFPSMLET